mmetsp:Transcript_34665/g.55451  ORF Transcript_34665/g.55451 Transcript_34665/m.55451 type:complete len:1517 (+) Transcript_34665:112-4662(+)|eukprot:CAMPEP_0203763110 /NCGR_PEP_ID=MMETSP0098-20131031/15794_1 /ASSEMBLY_ACC=CAM_ASM_000208 /TAXON_ID=96639 /ORGANISM=" , Strain NY0313808BC1" /LENGTH=1516 /DNA_ID=CAMNT_0050657715 /DNA_START=88 /DNA_END=4638 /DNA_ORIENTATION=+
MTSLKGDDVRHWIRSSYVPQVMVLSTETAEQVAEKNGLTISELLSPFGVIDQHVPFRTPAHAYALRDFRVAFVPAAELEPVPYELQESYLQQIVYSHKPTKSIDDELRDGPCDHLELRRFVKGASGQPWFTAYRLGLDRTFQHHETQLFGSPVGVLVIASTADKDPIACFEEFSSPHFLPSGFRRGQYDPAVPRFYVLLHDKSNKNTANVKASELVLKMQAALPPDRCYYVELDNDNSQEGSSKKSQKLWQKFVGQSFFNTDARRATTDRYGCYLTDADMESLSRFANELILSGVLAALEPKLFKLDQQVTAQRRGLRNTFRSLLWRKPKAEGGSGTSSPGLGDGSSVPDEDGAVSALPGDGSSERKVQYLHDTIEANIRLLADLAFMVQDYDMALGMYRLARNDFDGDNAYVHQGSALVMMALCKLMKHATQRDVLDYLRRANECFQKAMRLVSRVTPNDVKQKQVIARFQTNATLFFVDVVFSMGGNMRLFREATELLARASLAESNLRADLCAALLLEQTGLFLLYQELASMGDWKPDASSNESTTALSSRIRKFGFHMVLSSFLFKSCGHIEHASRCLAMVKNIYRHTRWDHINDHIDICMGENALQLGDVNHALPFYSQTLKRSKKPRYKQATILDDIEHNLRDHPSVDQGRVWGFGLPETIDQDVVVTVQSNASTIPQLSQVHESNLSNERQSETSSMYLTNNAVQKLEDATWRKMQKYLDKHTGQPNTPTHSRRRKHAVAVPESCYVNQPIFVDIPMKNPCAVKLNLTNILLIAFVVDDEGNKCDDSIEIVRTPTVSLKEDSTQMIRLSLVPKKAGMLQIVGAEWKLFGVGRVVHEFNIKGGKLNDTKDNRVAGARAQDMRLARKVVDQTAWLGVSLSLPDQLLEGEMVQTELELINIGNSPCSGKITVCCNIPGICVGAATSDIEDRIEKDIAPVLDDAGRLFEMPLQNLEVGLPVSVPVCIRVPTAGKFCFRLLFKYQGQGHAVRYLRLRKSILVEPCITLDTKTFPAPCSPGEYILSCTAHNRSATKHCSISRCVGLSASWAISLLGEVNSPFVIPPGQMFTLLLAVRKNHGTHHRSTIDLSPIAANDDDVSEDCRVHFMCLENASHVLRRRKDARAKYIRFKDRFEAEGKLPVSIQEVRRLNRVGGHEGDSPMQVLEDLAKLGKSLPGEPSPCSIESLEFGARSKQLHLLVEWTDSESYGQADSMNIHVYPKNPLILNLTYEKRTSARNTLVELTLYNGSDTTIEGATFLAKKGENFSWQALTKFRIPALRPGQHYSMSLIAVFHGTGLFELNTFATTLVDGAGEGTVLEFENTFPIIVDGSLVDLPLLNKADDLIDPADLSVDTTPLDETCSLSKDLDRTVDLEEEQVGTGESTENQDLGLSLGQGGEEATHDSMTNTVNSEEKTIEHTTGLGETVHQPLVDSVEQPGLQEAEYKPLVDSNEPSIKDQGKGSSANMHRQSSSTQLLDSEIREVIGSSCDEDSGDDDEEEDESFLDELEKELADD